MSGLRFIASGLAAVSAETISFLILLKIVHLPIVVASALSFLIGLCTSFVLNRQWTFSGDYIRTKQQQFVLYASIASVNLVLNSWIVTVLTREGVAPVLAKLLAISVISIWNFLLFRSVVFKHRASEHSS